MPAVRSYLYVPGHRREMLAKAIGSNADAVVVDLEDAVPASHKEEARANAVDVIEGAASGRIWVRVNPVGTEAGDHDLDRLAQTTTDSLRIRLAKCEGAADVGRVLAALGVVGRVGRAVELQCLLETAIGVERAFEIAAASDTVVTLALGEVDLQADLGAPAEGVLEYARARAILACRAARIRPPIQSVFRNLKDDEALLRSTIAGKAAGFWGRSLIHPRQIDIVHAAYEPSLDDLATRDTLRRHAEERAAAGDVAFVLDDGTFVDPAVIRASTQGPADGLASSR